MGFGIDLKVDVPKVPIPKVDVAAAVNSAKSAATGAVSGAVDSAKSAVSDSVNSAKNKVSDTIGSVTDAVSGADEFGIAKISISDGNQKSIDLEWEPQNAEQTDPENRFYWLNTFQLAVSTINDEECATRLTHLGFCGDTLTEQVNTYQTFFAKDPTGDIKDIRDEMVEWHDG